MFLKTSVTFLLKGEERAQDVVGRQAWSHQRTKGTEQPRERLVLQRWQTTRSVGRSPVWMEKRVWVIWDDVIEPWSFVRTQRCFRAETGSYGSFAYGACTSTATEVEAGGRHPVRNEYGAIMTDWGHKLQTGDSLGDGHLNEAKMKLTVFSDF